MIKIRTIPRNLYPIIITLLGIISVGVAKQVNSSTFIDISQSDNFKSTSVNTLNSQSASSGGSCKYENGLFLLLNNKSMCSKTDGQENSNLLRETSLDQISMN